MTPHAFAGSPPATSRVAPTTRFGRVRRPAWPAAPPRTRLTPINPLVGSGDRLGAEHRVDQAGEAAVELGAAQVQELARALLALGDHAGAGEGLEVMAAGRLADRNVELPAGQLGARLAAGDLAHDLQAHRVR